MKLTQYSRHSEWMTKALSSERQLKVGRVRFGCWVTFLKKASGFRHPLKAVLNAVFCFVLRVSAVPEGETCLFKGVNHFTVITLSGDLDGLGLPFFLFTT